MDNKVTVHVSYAEMHYDRQFPEGATVKEFAWQFLEEQMLDDGCFITINGKNMTRNLDYVLQDDDQIVVMPMVLSGG